MSLSEIRLQITRTLASDPLSEITIYETRRTISSDEIEHFIQVDLAHSDGGIDGNISPGYYAYSLYISQFISEGGVGLSNITGLVTFSGVSYVFNI